MIEEVFCEADTETIIKVIGIGNAGGNAVEHMMLHGLSGVEFIVANIDVLALERSVAPTKLLLGNLGLAAGATNPTIGQNAARQTSKAIRASLEGAHMLFIVAGMGGGTGSGAAPVIASIAQEMGILTIGMVTKPFSFEGSTRMQTAEAGIAELVPRTGSLIVIPNQNLAVSMRNDGDADMCFEKSNDVLLHAVGGITTSLACHLVGCDIEDIRTVMDDRGLGSMGSGDATGDNRAKIAAERAIASPLLGESALATARGIAVIISGTKETLKMKEVNDVMNTVKASAAYDADIIFGANYESDLCQTLRVVVAACGIDPSTRPKTPPPQPPKPPGGIGQPQITVDDLVDANIDRDDIPAFLRKNL